MQCNARGSDQISSSSSPLTHNITHSDDVVGRPVGVVHPLVGPPLVITHLKRGALHPQHSHEHDRHQQRHAQTPRRGRHLETATKVHYIGSTPLQGGWRQAASLTTLELGLTLAATAWQWSLDEGVYLECDEIPRLDGGWVSSGAACEDSELRHCVRQAGPRWQSWQGPTGNGN